MTYKEAEFSGCMFNPMCDKKMLVEYPVLLEIITPEWKEDKNLDKIIRYVIIMYDSRSPLLKEERDYTKRKRVAISLTKISEELAETILDGSNDVFFDFMIIYLSRYVKEKQFAALCAFEFKYYENIAELLTPIKGDTNAERLEAAKKKSVISDEIDKDIKRIDDYWNQIFGDKELVEKVKSKKYKPEMMGN